MSNQIPINLTEIEIATIVGLLEERIRFFKNELKKPVMNPNPSNEYKDFCEKRLKYYQQISDKLVSQCNQ